MKRRTFLRNSAFITVPLALNGHRISALSSLAKPGPFYDQTDRKLILVQLDGGNDGLNTLIPIDQYDRLYNLRSNIIIPENNILDLNDSLGFHPAMTGMKDLYDQGMLKIIQNAGYPSPNRSHFRSTDIWTSGSPSEENWTTGWIGRYFDSLYPGYPEDYPNDTHKDPFAITIATRVSETCQGSSANYSMAITDPANLNSLTEGNSDIAPNTPYGHELTFIRNAISQTNAYGEVVSQAAESGLNMSSKYDENNQLAMALKTVAKLISGGLQTSVYIVRVGGYDTHANQVVEGDVLNGEHAVLLSELSGAIEAFQDDIDLLGISEKVLGMTFTEFGRQIKSNESLGTDHGEAGPMFLFGTCVNPDLLGSNPSIPEQVIPQEALPYQIDFRNVYGSLLTDWFGMGEESVRELLFPDYIKLDLLDSCNTTHTDVSQNDSDLFVSPNPFTDRFTVTFQGKGKNVKIDLFNNLGQFKAHLFNAQQYGGEQRLVFSGNHLPSGMYFLRIKNGDITSTLRLIKN